jgi:hypothetical protein
MYIYLKKKLKIETKRNEMKKNMSKFKTIWNS